VQLPDGFELGVSDDSHEREGDDLDLIARLGVTDVRLPLAWAVAQPSGHGTLDASALAASGRTIDGLLARGIRPRVTLGGALPTAVEEAGGWRTRDTAERFAEYAARAAEALGDRVAVWETFDGGVGLGLIARHHALLGHGLAVPDVRRAAHPSATIEVALDVPVVRAVTEDAAEEVRRLDARLTRSLLGPVFAGDYPDDLLLDTAGESDWAFLRPGDAARIAVPVDGMTVAVPEYVAAVGAGRALDPEELAAGDALGALLARLAVEAPGLPVRVRAELPASDAEVRDGRFGDRERVTALHDLVRRAAATRGILLAPLLGGLVFVDPETRERVPADSALALRDLARTRELPADEPE
jgi:beta-glucosidase